MAIKGIGKSSITEWILHRVNSNGCTDHCQIHIFTMSKKLYWQLNSFINKLENWCIIRLHILHFIHILQNLQRNVASLIMYQIIHFITARYPVREGDVISHVCQSVWLGVGRACDHYRPVQTCSQGYPCVWFWNLSSNVTYGRIFIVIR